MSKCKLKRHLVAYALRGIHQTLSDRLDFVTRNKEMYEVQNDVLILCKDYLEISEVLKEVPAEEEGKLA